MKLTVLVDNNTLIDRYLIGEPGVCYYIETNEHRILFDTGYSAVFIHNAAILGIDLTQIDTLILSHGHNDHSWGVGHLMQHFDRCDLAMEKRIQLIAHPDAFKPKRYGNKPIGVNFPPDCYATYLEKITTKTPQFITPQLLFLGEIERNNAFEAQQPIGKMQSCCGDWKDDRVLDDSALVYIGSGGIVVITGCSHAGICNIVDYAIKVTGDKRVLAVIGGFHLQNADDTLLTHTATHLARVGVNALYPCHCTDLSAKIRLAQCNTIKEVGVGSVLSFI